jgi:predicted nucleotidyltransferase
MTHYQVHQDNFRELGVKSLELIDSVARDEARPNSDNDATRQ